MDWVAAWLWAFGLVVVGSAGLQVLWLTVGLVRRGRHESTQIRDQAELLALRVEAARKRLEHEEEKALTWAGWRNFVVARKVVEDANGEISSFYLSPHDSRPIPSFDPGQYLTLQLRIPGQADIVRCYSLSHYEAGPETYRLTIKRCAPPAEAAQAPHGIASSFLLNQVEEGVIVRVQAPRGRFFLDLNVSTPVVLIGGGIGVTPVLCMLEAIVAKCINRETWFFYGVRHGGEHIMKYRLREIGRDHPDIHVVVCYSNPTDQDVEDVDFHRSGRVTVDLLKSMLPANNYDFYVCGPGAMMTSITEGLAAWGVPKDRVHTEAFGPASVKKVTKPDSAAALGPEVKFRRSGKSAAWNPGDGNVLEFAKANGVSIESGCMVGNCGTCEATIVSGDVEYNEPPSYEIKKGTCLTCCCRPKGPEPLVLDV